MCILECVVAWYRFCSLDMRYTMVPMFKLDEVTDLHLDLVMERTAHAHRSIRDHIHSFSIS